MRRAPNRTSRSLAAQRAAGRAVSLSGLLKLGFAALAFVLVVFHVLLLWRRVADASLLEPEVALRWLAACLLMAAPLAALKAGIRLLEGRRAVIFWLLVLLLHVNVPAVADPAALSPAAPALLPLLWPLATGVLVALLTLAAAAAVSGTALRRLGRRLPQPAWALAGGPITPLYSRPPPRSLAV